MRIYLFVFFTFFSVSSYAGIYQDIQGGFQLISDFFTKFEVYLFTDVPNLAQRFWAWAIEWAVKLKLFLMLNSVEFAWGIAKQIITNLNVMTEITAQTNLLPQDVKQALVHMRVFDAINVLLTAHVTAYILRMV